MSRWSPRKFAVLAGAIVLSSLTGMAGGGEELRFVYLSNRAGISRTFDIILHDIASGKDTNLTLAHRGLGITSLSAPRLLRRRGSVVCFASGGKSLVEISLNGGPVRSLTSISQGVGRISVAPDEQAVLYVDRIGEKNQIVEADLMTGGTRLLTTNAWNCTEPSYSGDGRQIAYVTDQDGTQSIGLMRRDGGGQRVLTNDFGTDRYPCFTPAGDRIIFTSSRSGTHEGQFDLYSIDTSGNRFEILYANSAYNAFPSVSPDGNDVVFVSSNFAKKLSRVLLLNLASGTVSSLSGDLPLMSFNASFSPDGSGVLFENTSIRDSEIMLYDRGKKLLQNLSHNKGWDCSPSF